jgi:hypothetical protein
MRVIRKRTRVLFLAATVAAVAVPVGFALSLEPTASPVYETRSVAPASIVMRTFESDGAAGGVLAPLVAVPDGVKLLLIGTSLVGLSAVVRKAC